MQGIIVGIKENNIVALESGDYNNMVEKAKEYRKLKADIEIKVVDVDCIDTSDIIKDTGKLKELMGI